MGLPWKTWTRVHKTVAKTNSGHGGGSRTVSQALNLNPVLCGLLGGVGGVSSIKRISAHHNDQVGQDDNCGRTRVS